MNYINDEAPVVLEELTLVQNSVDYVATLDGNEGGFFDIMIGRMLARLPTVVRLSCPPDPFY